MPFEPSALTRRRFTKRAGAAAAGAIAAARSYGAPSRAVPLFDGKTLDGWIQIENSATSLAAAGIVDSAAFIAKVVNGSDPVSAFLRTRLQEPVKAGLDHLLDGVTSPIPLCADESCQDRADLPALAGRYAAINVKLDKAGGLTEALALIAEARAAGFEIMVGCMLCTSLAIAPAFLAAQGARWVDLDGPLLLARDRDGGFSFAGGVVTPGSAALWGEGAG